MAALGFAGLPRPSYDLPLHALRTWLDSWSGIGHVAVGMARQGYRLAQNRQVCVRKTEGRTLHHYRYLPFPERIVLDR
jgi:hypothetical protein